jgi:hypothetical protein
LNKPQETSSEDKTNLKATSRGTRRIETTGNRIQKERESSAKSITDEEMADIDRRIAAVIKAREKTDPKVEITDKEIEDIAKNATGTGVVPKVKTKGKKRGLIFGKDAKFRPFGGVLARALLGDDEKFGGERGAIDFIRTKKKKPVEKNQGGMMKKKGYKRGGAVGMSKPGNELPIAGKNPPKLSSSQQNLLRQAQAYANQTGQNPAEVRRLTSMYGDLNAAKEAKMAAAKDAKKARRQAGARGTGPRRMNMGGMSMKSKMASKGGKMGGMMPPGYKKGGSVSRKKARGVGAAKRGFGKAMR